MTVHFFFQGFDKPMVFRLCNIAFVVNLAVGIFLFICLTNHLMCDNVFHGYSVLSDKWKEIFDGTVYLVCGEWLLKGIALEFYSYGEEITIFSISEDRAAGMPCHVGRCGHNISGAIVIDDHMGAYFLLW